QVKRPLRLSTMHGSIKRVVGMGVLAALLVVGLVHAGGQEYGGGPAWNSLNQELGPIGSFTLIDKDGKAFSSDQLLGKVWVAHFFYVACRACNQTNPVLGELQEFIRARPDLMIVSISLNGDTPEDLQRFSEGWGAVPGQWLFLTGSKTK